MQRGVGAGLLGRAAVSSIACAVSLDAAAGDHRHPALRDLDRDRDHPAMLVVGQGRAFAGGPARHQRVAALGDLPFDELAECVFSDTAAAKMASPAPESSRKT